MRISRRTILRVAGAASALTLLGALFPISLAAQGSPDADRRAFDAIMAFAKQENLQPLPLGDVMTRLGRHFVGTPYTPHTLEAPGAERLIVNLREFDCTTFMENVLVLARCITAGRTGYEEYRKDLQFVRYRGGAIDGYPSRLHYFTDWVHDNEGKNVLQNISRRLGGTRSRKRIDFMSTHPENYPQLADKTFLRRVADVERQMNARGFTYVPRTRVAGILAKLRGGDIIGTVTSMKGMDVAHTGIVVIEEGIPRFLHAPLSGKKVLLSGGSLADYVQALPSVIGIVVVRPREGGVH